MRFAFINLAAWGETQIKTKMQPRSERNEWKKWSAQTTNYAENGAAAWKEGEASKEYHIQSLNSDINYEKFTVKDKNLLKFLWNKLNH